MHENKYKILLWKKHTEKYENYWNNQEIKSVFDNINKEEYLKLEQYLEEQGFFSDLEKCLELLLKKGKTLSGVGIELASGAMWLTAHIMKNFYDQIHQFYSLDYSKKFIFHLGPKLLNHYKIAPEKLTLCLGSFYEIKLPAESLDFIIMSQAFHHAEDPDKLLKEAYRVLKKDGFLIMIGEIFIPKALYFKCYLNYIASKIISSRYFPNFLAKWFKIFRKFQSKNLKASFQELYFPPDIQLGDHYYLKSQYENFFLRNKFEFLNVKSKQSSHLAYVILKHDK